MDNSHLAQLLKSLSPVELRAFDRFLQSPYFNLRADVYQLFKALYPNLKARRPLPDRMAVFQNAFPGKLFSSSEMRQLMTYLVKLFGQYAQTAQLALEPDLANLLGIKALHRLNLEKEGAKAIEVAFDALESRPLRSAEYHNHQYQLLYEQARQRRKEPEENARYLRQLTEKLYISMAATRLRQACLMLSEKAVYKMESDNRFMPEFFQWAESGEHLKIPAISAYYYACKLLLTEEESWFQHLKTTIFQHSDGFPPQEMHDLYVVAINYCVRQLNTGKEQYFQETYELYKAGLEAKTLLHKGVLSPMTYYNIVISGLKVNAFDWVAWFIPQYKNSLERPHRDSAYSFNMARLYFARRDYGEALVLLQKANYRDLLTNLSAKTMALKIYFEQGEYEVLLSHLDAMTHYLRRNRIIGYHQENYLNLIKATKRLIALPKAKGTAHERLREQIESTNPLTERAWLLAMLASPFNLQKGTNNDESHG
jgi:hypothetical protein